MAEASIPVDLFNPGQVFACIGFVEAADVLLGDAEGAFDWSATGAVRFHIRAAGDVPPIQHVLQFMDRADARAIAPAGSASLNGWISSWDPGPIMLDRDFGYPYPDPPSPATLACSLSDGTHSILIDHWGDATRRDNAKFWGGARGYPGAALARDALRLVRGRAADAASDPFALSAPQSSSFRFDWRRDYIPIDTGFSLNAHSHIQTLGYPLVEVLAAIGLGNARPMRPDPRDKLSYQYAVVGRAQPEDRTWLPPEILRVALGTSPLPFPMRRFHMLLGSPGQEGKDRSITTVTEENIA